jgi:hypothetical protein
MPIPGRLESEEPQADAGLLEFINRRRLQQARQRRQRALVIATAALGLTAVALAVSNVILIRRLVWHADGPAPVTVSPPAPVAAASARPPDPAVPAASSAPVTPGAPATPPAESPRAAAAPPAPDGESARRTARWLVQTHGRVEAENRAAKAAEFYSGEQSAYWRRVLLSVRQER